MPSDERFAQRAIDAEIRDALRQDAFALGGLNQLVKVLPLAGPLPKSLSGYVTLERYLLGLKPSQIAAALGLPAEDYTSGCRVFGFNRQPGPSEYTYELTTQYPEGLAYGPLSHPQYPPGTKKGVHQFKLRVKIAVTLLKTLGPNDAYTASNRLKGR